MYSSRILWCIYLKDNYLILTQFQTFFQKANTIVRNFIKQNIKYLDLFKAYLVENAKIYQHLYTTLYPHFYSRYNKFGAENWTIFELYYRDRIYNRKKNIKQELGVINKLLLNKQKLLKIQKFINNDLLWQLANLNRFQWLINISLYLKKHTLKDDWINSKRTNGGP